MSDNMALLKDKHNLKYWGNGYFAINDQGNVICHPDGNKNHPGVDLEQLTHAIIKNGLSLPVLIRFKNILHHRLETLGNAFATAKKNHHYEGDYTAIYPIKVNQQRSVVDEITQHQLTNVGLEAGSKAELLAVLALSDNQGGIIICNGYKDEEYLRLALIGQKMGHRVFIVIEKQSELDLVISVSESLEVTPLLGIRVRLMSIGKGYWQNSGGEKSKFGLSTIEILATIQKLKSRNQLHYLQLLHFHLGSQIANIRDIQKGLREAARHFVELCQMGVNLKYLDAGGGLGIDYEGTRSRSFCSINYSIEEYANNIIHTFAETCEHHHLPHPDILTESGRAITAHHAVLITNVIDIESVPQEIDMDVNDTDPGVIHDLHQTLCQLPNASLTESYHDATQRYQEAQEQYIMGLINMQQRANAEKYYFSICHQLRKQLDPAINNQKEILSEIKEMLADKVFCNFSVFQSMPDIWALHQIFPVLPIHYLNEPVTRDAIIQDITCDSDGKINRYVENKDLTSTLSLCDPPASGYYLMGFFLLGAYQEILGDMHNLFGDTNSINIEYSSSGEYKMVQMEKGDNVNDLLEYVHINAMELIGIFKQKMKQTDFTLKLQQQLLQELEDGLTGYTYME